MEEAVVAVQAVVEEAVAVVVAVGDAVAKKQNYEKDHHSLNTNIDRLYRTGYILSYDESHYFKRSGFFKILF
jgi:competence protein ComGC